MNFLCEGLNPRWSVKFSLTGARKYIFVLWAVFPLSRDSWREKYAGIPPNPVPAAGKMSPVAAPGYGYQFYGAKSHVDPLATARIPVSVSVLGYGDRIDKTPLRPVGGWWRREKMYSDAAAWDGLG